MKLVLLPGLNGTSELFGPIVSALPQPIDPVLVSYPMTEKLGYEALTEIARRALPKDEPFALLGESFSGPIAATLASECDSNLRALIFSCSFVRNPSKTLSLLRSIVPLLPIHGALPRAARNLLLGNNSAEVRELVATSLSKVTTEVIRGRLQEVLAVDVTTSLQKVAAPILYLRASDDRMVKRRSGDYIQQIMPSTRIIEIGGSHLLLQSEPGKCAATISEFLEEIVDAQ